MCWAIIGLRLRINFEVQHCSGVIRYPSGLTRTHQLLVAALVIGIKDATNSSIRYDPRVLPFGSCISGYRRQRRGGTAQRVAPGPMGLNRA